MLVKAVARRGLLLPQSGGDYIACVLLYVHNVTKKSTYNHNLIGVECIMNVKRQMVSV